MKNKTIKSSLISTALLSGLIMASSAQANGLYVFGSIGSSSLDHSIERSLDANAPTLPAPDAGGVSSVDESDFSAGVGIGYKFDINDDVYVAVEGFYDNHNNSSRNINGVLVTDIDLDASYGARLLAGVNINEKFSIYVHGGYTELDYDVSNSYTFAPPTRSRSDTEGAFSFGIGADYKINDNYILFTQYSQTEDVSFDGIPEVAGGTGRVNDNDLDLSQFTVGLRYAF